MKIAIICGGPGAERGISINSARSVMDHLQSDTVEILPFYYDVFMSVYQISTAQLYSNTPSDFDFKLRDKADRLTNEEFIEKLKQVDITFPLIHGIFGETGDLQQLLEDNNIPYIGGSAAAYKKAFPKDSATSTLRDNGFYTLPFVTVERTDLASARTIADEFFKRYNLDHAIIKPVLGGSSIGTYEIHNTDDAVFALHDSVKKHINVGERFLIEPFCHGREFSVTVIQNSNGKPVCFVPIEMEITKGSKIFNFRKKYLSTDACRIHCPARFTTEQIHEIQTRAEKVFELFSFNDYVRLDGWLLDDGNILFSDINTVTGMDQCSFIFEQSARIGFTHSSILNLIVRNACRRYGIPYIEKNKKASTSKKKVFILMGGKTAERQTSLMSGTNVWLKLLKSKQFTPTPFLLDKDGCVWQLPYTFALNHTVEEVHSNCEEADKINTTLEPYAAEIYKKLGLPNSFSIKKNTPIKMTLDEFSSCAASKNAFVFIALHGGEGENGTIQRKLKSFGLTFSGSDARASRIGMDKYETGRLINEMNNPDIYSLPKKPFNIQHITDTEARQLWDDINQVNEFGSVAVKPLSDGCSSGVVRLYSLDDFRKYIAVAKDTDNEVIPPYTFQHQENEINLPQDRNPIYFLEPFIQVDYLRVENNDIIYHKHKGWLEFTVGVMEKCGEYHAFNPSITIAEGEVLSLEEKFQSGTGVNITPPPERILKPEFREKIKRGIEIVANAMGIKNYSRIDIFFNVESGKMIVIEANSLPGMTPSTVIYHQALAENPPLTPVKFIETIINNKLASVEYDYKRTVGF